MGFWLQIMHGICLAFKILHWKSGNKPSVKNAPPAREAGGRGKKDSHRVSAAA